MLEGSPLQRIEPHILSYFRDGAEIGRNMYEMFTGESPPSLVADG